MSLIKAMDLARANPVRGLPKMAALIMKRRDVLGIGFNSYQTHPLAAKFGKNDKSYCLHAEIAAIVDATRKGHDIEGATIYVARAFKDGTEGLAKPCIGCARAIVAYNLKDCVWTDVQKT